MAKSSAPSFELLRWEDPNGVSPFGLPKRHEHHRYVGHVYVAELSNGTTKVGMTADPFKRIRQHADHAAAFDFKIVRLWLSIAHRDAAKVEQHLIGYGRQNSASVARQEYFTGLDFDAVTRFAGELEFKPIDEAEIAELIRIEREKPPMFGYVNPNPVPTTPPPPMDLHEWFRDRVADLFGRRPDGSYVHGSTLGHVAQTETAEDAEALWVSLCGVADAKGWDLGDVLRMSVIDTLKELIMTIVSTEATRLHTYAIENGIHRILEPQGNAIKRALPSDDPRFDQDASMLEDSHWEWDSERGWYLWVDDEDEDEDDHLDVGLRKILEGS